MDYQQLLQRTRQEHILFSVLLELTYQCNLDCFYCYNEKNLKGTPLGLADYRRLLNDLAAMGVMELTLSGGEPLAHPDFMAIGSHAKKRGFVVRIKSNGHSLDKQRARRIQQEIDPFVIDLSLHGATAATHDRQTRVAGSFERLMGNIRGMQEIGLRLRFNATLTLWNEHELVEMYELADRLGIVITIDDQVTRRDDGDGTPLGIFSTAGATHELRALRKARAVSTDAQPDASPEDSSMDEPGHSGQKLCGAGCSTLLVDPFGTVYPCVNWRKPAGNLHEQSIGDIWQRSAELKRVRNEQVRVRNTLRTRGDLAAGIPFCPGIAERETGDPGKRYGAVKRSLPIRLPTGEHSELNKDNQGHVE